MSPITARQLEIIHQITTVQQHLSQFISDLSQPAPEFDDINDSVGTIDECAHQLHQTASATDQLLAEYLKNDNNPEEDPQ